MKLRWNAGTNKGVINTEDLWDLPLPTLNAVAVGLHRSIKEAGEVSFITESSAPNKVLQLKFDVVKHIIDTKLVEKKRAEELAVKRQKREQIMALIQEKEHDGLRNQSLDDLKRMFNELDD